MSAQTTVESFAGNGTKSYVLHSVRTLIDGSEQIFINNRFLTRTSITS